MNRIFILLVVTSITISMGCGKSDENTSKQNIINNKNQTETRKINKDEIEEEFKSTRVIGVVTKSDVVLSDETKEFLLPKGWMFNFSGALNGHTSFGNFTNNFSAVRIELNGKSLNEFMSSLIFGMDENKKNQILSTIDTVRYGDKLYKRMVNIYCRMAEDEETNNQLLKVAGLTTYETTYLFAEINEKYVGLITILSDYLRNDEVKKILGSIKFLDK